MPANKRGYQSGWMMCITMQTGERIFICVSKQISTCIYNLIKCYRAFRVIVEHVFEKIYLKDVSLVGE